MTRKEEREQAANAYAVEAYYNDVDKNVGFADFLVGAEWADKTMLDKVCEWINEHKDWYIETEDNGIAGWITDEFVEELRKAMGV